MALPINIESLLSGSAVESNQLEYKEGWNPDTIYRSICAFANDFEDTGGGYIIVGVKEERGHAVRPVLGVNPNLIEQIEKDMVGTIILSVHTINLVFSLKRLMARLFL